jgi:hypothetical protein
MSTDLAITELKGKDVSCHYDIPTGRVCVRFGENYEDKEAGDFFGNDLKKGEPAGFVFLGISAYTPANGDHIQIGKLVAITIEGESRCRLDVANSEVPGMGGSITFSFQCLERIYA